MPSFKDLSVEFDVGSLYEGGIKVFLESEDDLAIIRDKWFFNQKDALSFESVSDAGGGSGGCLKVIDRVRTFEKDGRPAFGIVDRDALLQDKVLRDTLWWESDDEQFAESRPFGDSVHVLRRWELENYLLHPAPIRQWLKDKLCSPNEPDLDAADLLNHENDFITLSCISPLAISKAKPSPNEQFGRGNTGHALANVILEHLSASKEEMASHKSKIRAFAEENEDPEKRWERLNRMLDGKRVLYRLSDHFNNELKKKGLNLNLFADRAIIAGYVRNCGTIDSELTETINGFTNE